MKTFKALSRAMTLQNLKVAIKSKNKWKWKHTSIHKYLDVLEDGTCTCKAYNKGRWKANISLSTLSSTITRHFDIVKILMVIKFI